VEWRQQAGHRASQHRLAGTGWTSEEQMMATGRSNLEGGSRRRLAPNLGKVGNRRRLQLDPIDVVSGMSAPCDLHGVGQRSNRQNPKVLPSSRFRHRLPRKQTQLAEVSSHEGSSEASASRANRTVERQFTKRNDVGGARRELAVRSEDTESDRQVIRGADLRKICRRQVHHDPFRWKGDGRRRDGSPHTFLGFAHRGIRKPNNDKTGVAAPNMCFDAHGVRLNTDDGA
jgi:hypothetical protein